MPPGATMGRLDWLTIGVGMWATLLALLLIYALSLPM
jgi:hypothetical protein